MTTHYRQIKKEIDEKVLACGRRPDEVTIVIVSKNRSVQAMQEVYLAGGRIFGESRVQEALPKMTSLPSCQWHFIGTLQANKVLKAIPHFSLVHSVDTLFLAQKISQISQAKQVVTPILLQVNTSGEKTKHGLSEKEWQDALELLNRLPHIRIEGLMTMAPYTSDFQLIRLCFRRLYQLREEWRKQMKEPTFFRHLSMGMSNDYLIAIEEGATLLRLGSAIFGG